MVAINKNEIHPTTLTTSVNQIKYRAQGSDGEDKIKVEVFIKQGVNRTRVDDEIAFVSIIPFEMKITPNNQTISGGTGIDLSVVDDKGKDFSISDISEYSFVWKTNGQFGKYNGTRNTVSQNLNKIRYEALERTQEGMENISVSVYRKAKGSNESPKFLQTVEGSVNINNDPKKKYYVLTPIFTITKLADEACTAGASDVRNWLDSAIYVNKIANAKSYSLKITEIFSGPSKYALWDTKSAPDLFYSWNQGDTRYKNTNTNTAVSDAAFTFSLAATATNTCNPDYSDSLGWVSGTRGVGQLVVTLE